jgi:hypothetical protein
MPKQKNSKSAASTATSSQVHDARFSNFATDPRYRLPSKKSTRTKLDKRFSRLLTDDEFTQTSKVDRYGRKLKVGGKKKALERLYMAEDEESNSKSKKGTDDANDDEESKQTNSISSENGIEVEEDDVVQEELRKYDPARGGGFSSSEDENSDEEDGGVEIEEAEFPDMQAEATAVEMGEITPRFAVVNLDWDNIKSTDLMAVFSSFVPAGGSIHKISIYPSEFGKERMQREELEGPPKEIFAKPEDELSDEGFEDSEEDEDIDEKIQKDLLKGDDGQEFDGAALRQYQLERLRYYYAVVVCSDNETAQKIYESCDGSEYLSSANFFDLRFIPDGTDFDDMPRDECDSVPAAYRPIEFVTDALQHSKVKLTWDMAPDEMSRKDAINRAFTGSRADIGDNDLRAYLGSDTEDDEEESKEVEANEPKLSKKDLARKKMREALGLPDEPTAKASKKAGPVGEMEITFTAGLSNTKGGVFENEPIKEETTAERYIRLEKERKARRKEKAKAKREGLDPGASESAARESKGDEAEEDLGFDDPFFATEPGERKTSTSKSQRKEDRIKKREQKAAEEASKSAELESLKAIMSADAPSQAHLDHFDINEIARAEKRAKQKGKKRRKGGEEEVEGGKRGGLQQGFEMDVGDERFSKVFDSHEFAIDPSNPKFKGTEGMKKLLEEGRRKRGLDNGEGGDEVEPKEKKSSKKRKMDQSGEDSIVNLSGLVEMVKKKSKR